MNARFASVLVVLGLVACGDSAGTPEPTPSASEGAAALSPSLTSMRPDVSPEDLAAIRGREASRSERALAEVERRFASWTPGLSFRVGRVRTNGLGDTHVWIQQVFQGTPVTGRDLGVIVFGDDTLQVLGEPDSFEGVTPARMKAADGLKRARAHVARKGLTVADTGDVVLEPVYERRLRPGASGKNAADYATVVARFERGTRVKVTSAFAPDAPREVFVREHDGAVLERAFPPSAGMVKGSLRSAFAGNVTLPTYLDGKGLYNLLSERLDYISVPAQRGGSAGFDYTSKVNSWGDNQLYNFGGPATLNGQTAAADAFISIYGTNRMFSDVYSRNGWDGQGGAIHAYVHAAQAGAYAVGGGAIMLGYVPQGSGLSNVPVTDIETVGHEVGHMTFEELTGKFAGTTGELGGLDEGTADIFGLVAGFYLPDALALAGTSCTVVTCNGTGPRRPITVRKDWTQGNWGDARYGRSFIDPFLYPAWAPGIETADAHYASGPLARMFYFLSVGVLPAGQAPVAGLLQPQRESFYLPRGLTGLGIDAANWLWFTTLQGVFFARVTDYPTAREQMLEATAYLYPSMRYTPQYKAVEDAWAAVNVGPPADRTLPTVSISTAQLSSTEATVTVDVSDDNGIASGTVTIASAVAGGPSTTLSCTGSCVFTLNPLMYGTHPSHSVMVTAKDLRENTATQVAYFGLDASTPKVSITSNKAASWSPIAPQQDWRYSAVDATGIRSAKVLVDGVAVVNESWAHPSVPSFTLDSVVVDVSSRAEGWYPVRFETTDVYGNAAVSTFSLAVDRTDPELCSLSASADPASGKVYLTLTARDALSGMSGMAIHQAGVGILSNDATKVGGGVQRTLSHTVTLAPGTYTFYGACGDQSSNVVQTPNQTVSLLSMCNTTSTAGGAQVDERTFQMGRTSGTVTLSYHTYSVHDRIKVYSGTSLVADTGCVSTGYPSALRTKTFAYSGTTGQLKVRVEPNCDPSTALPSTEWLYSLSCP